MNHMVEFMRTDTFLWIMLLINIILLILYITNVIYMKKTKKEYYNFIQKLLFVVRCGSSHTIDRGVYQPGLGGVQVQVLNFRGNQGRHLIRHIRQIAV